MLSRPLALIVTFGLALPVTASAQLPLQAGRLLVSTPDLDDALFSETVILLVHYDDMGAVGVFLNRPTNLSAGSVFSDVAELADYSGTIYFGGPVRVDSPLMLHRNAALGAELHVFDDVYLTVQTELIGAQPAEEMDESRSKIFAGRAEWAPGQLESEISTGAWRIVDASSGVVFTPNARELWPSALYFNSEQTVRLAP